MEEKRDRRDHRIVSGFITMLVYIWSECLSLSTGLSRFYLKVIVTLRLVLEKGRHYYISLTFPVYCRFGFQSKPFCNFHTNQVICS